MKIDLSFQVDAHGTTSLYFSIRYFKVPSTGIRLGYVNKFMEIAELESILLSNPYGTIGRELGAEATIKSLGSSDGLDLQFWGGYAFRRA